jgi:hypothetical protein
MPRALWDYVCQSTLVLALCLHISSVTDISFRVLYSQFSVDLLFFSFGFLSHKGTLSGDLSFCFLCFFFLCDPNFITAPKTNFAVIHIV